MSDKFLTELEWKKFSKGRGLKDSALTRALAALENAKAPDAELEALSDIEKQADLLRKAAKSDKEVGAYFDSLDKALDKQRKLSEFESRKAARLAEQADDEEDAPDLLTTRMAPLLKQVKKGAEMNVLLAVVGKEVAVMVSRRAISPARRRLLADYLDAGTPKFFIGHCVFEEKAYTFVMKTQAAGLAKKVRAALLRQLDLRLKVRVRGEDPNDIDDDGEPDDGDDLDAADQTDPSGPVSPARATVAPGPATVVPPVAKPVPAEPAAPPAKAQAPAAAPAVADPLQDQFETRMAAIEPRVMAALRDQSGDVSKIRAVASFVREKGDSGQYKAALAGMESLARLLDAAPAQPAAPAPTDRPEPVAVTAVPAGDATAFNSRLAALLPAVKAAMAVGGEGAAALKRMVGEAGALAQRKAFGPAGEVLDGIEASLRPAPSAAPSDAMAPDGAGSQWEARFSAVEARYLETLRRNPASAGELRTVMAYAVDQNEDGEHGKAIAALERLDRLLSAAAASRNEAGYTGIVAYRKTLLDLRTAVARVDSQIAGLLKAIPAEMPEEADLAGDLAEELREASDELQDLVDEAMGTAEDEDTPITRALVQRLDSLIAKVAANEVIRHVDANPFGVPMSIETTLTAALRDVRAALPVPA